MGDLNNRAEQEKVLKEILSRYDDDTQRLYWEILKMYSEKGSAMTKSKVREEILERVKGVVK